MKWVEQGEADVAFTCSTEKANIFLIGDSIRRGYCATVKEDLADVAEVFYVAENCRNTQYVITCLKKWTAMFDDPTRVTLVQFNCGQWDAAHWNFCEYSLTSESEYARNIRIIIKQLREFFPNARLVFATTTPMNPDGKMTGSVNPRSNAEIDRYNAIAVPIAREQGVLINDLHAFMTPWDTSHFTDLCHLKRESFALLGHEVARYLRELL